MMEKQNGLTIIVLSYERIESLRFMLESLLAQNLGNISFELIICNNSHRIHLKQSRFSVVGRLFRKFSDIKIINVNYSWRTNIRYALATLAKYETVLFLDDDIVLRDQDFVFYMYENYKNLTPVDLLSCWNRLWVEWDESSFSAVSLTFQTPGIVNLTRCDVAGPGICMFDKRILTPEVFNVVMTPVFPKAYDMAFSLIASLEHNSQCYYLPSYEMLEFHEQSRKSPLMATQEPRSDMHAMFKFMLAQGYKPVLSKLSPLDYKKSPEKRAVDLLPSSQLL